jgi:hypothetical protein
MRPLKLFALGAAMALGLSAVAHAKNYVVWGVGTKTCGAWTDAKLTNKERAETFQSWVHAFMTGAAYGREGLDIRRNVKFEAEALTAWVDTYCEANPLMTVERAAVALLDHIDREPEATKAAPK